MIGLFEPEQAAEERVFLRRAIEKLDPRDQKILTLRYGLDGAGKHTFREIGEQIGGVCSARARELEARAVRRLRRKLQEPKPPVRLRPERPKINTRSWWEVRTASRRIENNRRREGQLMHQRLREQAEQAIRRMMREAEALKLVGTMTMYGEIVSNNGHLSYSPRR